MRTKKKMTLLCLAAAALLAACEQNGATVALGGEAQGLVGEDAADAAIEETDTTLEGADASAGQLDDAVAAADEADPQGDDEPRPLVVTWTDGAESSPQAKLSFQVTNTTPEEIAFTVDVVAKSLIGDGEKHVGKAVLGPGESTEFHVTAAALPVRSSAVVGQLFVKLTREIEGAGGIAIDVVDMTTMRYFRHEKGYVTVWAYTDEALETELGGVLLDLPTVPTSKSSKAMAAILGEKGGDGKKTEPVSLASSGLVDYDAAGNLTGVVTSYRTGSADARGIGMIWVGADETGAEGLEVEDE